MNNYDKTEFDYEVKQIDNKKQQITDIYTNELQFANNKVTKENAQMKQDLLTIINHYGIDKQLKYIHSEYYELDEAIINAEWTRNIGVLRNPAESSVKHIAEEISDCLVMLKQFQYYYGIEDKEIEDIMKFKIQRQLDRIKEEK